MREFDRSYGADKYIRPLDLEAPDYKDRVIISNMFTYLDDFMNTLNLQLSRIEESNLKINALANRPVVKFEDRMLFVQLWADYYFFLNTMERTYRIAKRLYKRLGETGKAQEIKYSKRFNDIRSIRNGIEHLYEDITKKNGEEFYSQHRSMSDRNEITIKGISFAANEESMYPLYNIYDDISRIIEEKYIIPNRDIVDRIWPKPTHL